MAFRLLLGLGLSNFFDRAGVESAQFGSDGFGGRGGDGLLRAVMVGLVVREHAGRLAISEKVQRWYESSIIDALGL